MPKISVILCAHNPRAEYLQRVLDGLRRQTMPFSEWELLLVDNGSQSPLEGRFDLSWHPQGRHIREDDLGLTPARLRGIKESVADLLVFVDDDTVLAENYLERAFQVGCEWPFVGVWGGSSIPEFETPLPTWVGIEVWRLTSIEVKTDVWSNLREGFATTPVGAGMCVRRSVALFFSDRCNRNRKSRTLGRTGTTLVGYEDVEIAHCAMDLGLGAGRTTKLRLSHLVPASRLTLDYFVRHAEGDAYSLQIFRAMRGLPIDPPPRVSAMSTLRYFVHRWLKKIPREQVELQKAHRRGHERGYLAAMEYLRTKSDSAGDMRPAESTDRQTT